MTAAELFAALMAATSPVEVSRLAAKHLRGPLQYADVTDRLTPVQREHLPALPARCSLGQLGQALIRHTDTEDATS